jgi:hypothetical protein
VAFLRRQARRGLRADEELLLEVEVEVVDASGTSLPDAGTPVAVGVSDQRILVWSIPRPPMRSSRLLGGVARSRLLSAVAERRDERVAVVLDFEEGARLEVEAPAERHPEQLVWLLTAEPPSDGQ